MESHHPRRCVKAKRSEWKEKLREGCLSRVRENRNQLLWKIRLAREATEPKEIAVSAFGQIISDELQKFKQSCHGDIQSAFIPDNDDTLWDYKPSEAIRKLDKDEYEEILLEMEQLLHDDIQAELKQRDAALLEDYEKTCELEEESVAAVLFEHMKIQEQNGGLVCPICRKGYLNQERQFIYCECCQLKLDTQNDQRLCTWKECQGIPFKEDQVFEVRDLSKEARIKRESTTRSTMEAHACTCFLCKDQEETDMTGNTKGSDDNHKG